MVADGKVIRSTCGLCQIGCGVLVHTDNGKVIRIEGDPENPLSRGELCAKGRASLEYLYHPDRIKQPLRRTGERGGGGWQTISWDEALSTVADKFRGVKENYGAESVIFIQGSAKGNFQDNLIRRFASAFGSPNYTTQEHVCFVPRRNASRMTYGFYAIPDFDHPPAGMVVWGKNLEENLFHVSRRLRRALESGSRLMVIDPRKISGVENAELWLQPRPGSDLALALGMMHVIINEGLFDKDFVDKYTTGFDILKTHVQEYTPQTVSEITWIAPDMIEKAARFYAGIKPTCLQWGNAIDHGVNSFQTARALCILRAITGNLETPGGDLRCALPGLRDIRNSPEFNLSNEIPPEVQKRVIRKNKVLPINNYVLPQDVMSTILTEEPYPIQALYIHGCNALLTYPNAQKVYLALSSVDFIVATEMFMTPTAAMADIVLPVTTYLEDDDIIMPPYSLPIAMVRQKAASVGECRCDYDILKDLALRLGLGDYFWDSKEDYLDYVLEPLGISFEEFGKIGVIEGRKQYRTYQSQGFATPSGKVEIYSEQLKKWDFDPLPVYRESPETPLSAPELLEKYPLVLTSGKSGFYRHSGGRQIESLRKKYPEPTALINTKAAAGLGISDGDSVFVETSRGKVKQKALLSPDIDPRVVVVDYGWWFPEQGGSKLYGWSEANLNMLTDNEPPFNLEMGTTNLRGMVCKVYRTQE